jgi:hypothetical protein
VSPVAVSLWGRHTVEGRAQLTENGFTDVVVAISPDIPEDPAIIDKIKVRLRYTKKQCCGYDMFSPIQIFPSWIYGQKGTKSGTATKEVFITQKLFTKLSEM